MLYLVANNNNDYLQSLTVNGNRVEEAVFTPISSDAKHMPKFMADQYKDQLCSSGFDVHVEEWIR